MFARAARLHASRDFAKVYRKGQSARSRLFRLAWIAGTKPRVAVVIGRKVSTKAVTRNRLKRQTQAAAAALYPNLAPADLILQIQPAAVGTTYQALMDELADLLRRAGLLKEPA